MFSKPVYFWLSLAVLLPGTACAKADNPLAVKSTKHNSHAPIEVTSDSLEVLQEQNKAIFTGNVVAIQADTRLKADKMTVFYAKPAGGDKSSKDKATAAKAKGKPQDAKTPAGAIKKINADGNVFLSTPEETASGDNGIYDVDKQEIHLNKNVVLTRGQNVLKGDTLVYNFATGRSVLSGGSSDAAKSDKPTGGRVHALFVPADKQKDADAPKTKKKAPQPEEDEDKGTEE